MCSLDNFFTKKQSNYSVPLFEKEGLGEILLDKSPRYAYGLRYCLNTAYNLLIIKSDITLKK